VRVPDCDTMASLRTMSAGFRRPAILLALALLAGALGGCASINEKLSAGMADAIPVWAGGLPAGAPPRPGTAEYDEYMKERQRQRLMPAADREQQAKAAQSAAQSGLDPVH
jgi:hypothetical protein